ncbi:hypothetical protein PoB_006416900 [Plakobranchus ocellatus]|uniref:Uncharacterized protein n=1 Tax=Plakobranchus ocellatus TaxID=259542 RepID=A0AAV4D0I8_9GAST|nr:hypothetical protein PoB_006416900 [Plakobranchus ocellatus]
MLLLTLLVVTLGLTSADKCEDEIANCESSYWTPFKDVAIPDLRCDASMSWLNCLLALGDCGVYNFTGPLDAGSRNCFDTGLLGLTSADKCEDKVVKCESSYWTPFKDVAIPDLRCEASMNWLKCLLALSDCGVYNFTGPLDAGSRNCFDTGQCYSLAKVTFFRGLESAKILSECTREP